MPTPQQIAVEFIEAFGRGESVSAFLAADVTFTSPRVSLTGAEAVASAIGEFAQVIKAVDIVAAVGDDTQAMIMYDMETGPFGTIRAVDHLVVRDGKISSDVLVFDTAAL